MSHGFAQARRQAGLRAEATAYRLTTSRNDEQDLAPAELVGQHQYFLQRNSQNVGSREKANGFPLVGRDYPRHASVSNTGDQSDNEDSK